MNGLRPPRGGVSRELSSSYSGSRLPALGAGSPVRFVVRGKFGPGWLRRHLPPDVGLRPVRTQEAAGLSSDCWKAHLQAPAKSSSYKTVVVFNYCVDTRVGLAPIFADAHRCASDAYNSHKLHQIVKKKIVDQNIVILDSYFSFLRMDKTK